MAATVSFAVLLGLLLPVAQETLSAGQGVQRFLCERSYINFAWGFQLRGIFVDRDGRVYRFDNSGTRPSLASGPEFSEAELAAKYGERTTLVRTVPREQLDEMTRLIPAAAKGRLSDRTSPARDSGSLASLCYVFDATRGSYRKVELDVKGDWEYHNLAPEARRLAAWLESLDAAAAGKGGR